MIDRDWVTATVRQRVTMRCADVAVSGASLEVELGFIEHDPYAVTASFDTSYGTIVWTFARELLINGLTGPTGEGDVEVWPAVGSAGGACVMIEFRSPDGELVVETASRGITEFVNRTLDLVPAGTEGDHFDVDVLIGQLLTV